MAKISLSRKKKKKTILVSERVSNGFAVKSFGVLCLGDGWRFSCNEVGKCHSFVHISTVDIQQLLSFVD